MGGNGRDERELCIAIDDAEGPAELPDALLLAELFEIEPFKSLAIAPRFGWTIASRTSPDADAPTREMNDAEELREFLASAARDRWCRGTSLRSMDAECQYYSWLWKVIQDT